MPIPLSPSSTELPPLAAGPPAVPAVVIVTVEDRGVGIPADARPSLFKLFSRAQRLTGGTGLGLFTLRKRIEALGGHYGCSKRSDRLSGSSFWFTFPYRPDVVAAAADDAGSEGEEVAAEPAPVPEVEKESEAVVMEAAPVPVQPVPVRPEPLRIIIVDDEQVALKGMRRALRGRGHTVTEAVNGQQCLDRLLPSYTARLVGCVITDLQMPIMDGLEMILRFRGWEERQQKESMAAGLTPRPHVMIVATSATDDHSTRKASLDAGADFFLPKVRRMPCINDAMMP